MPKRTLLFTAIIFIIQTGPAFAQGAFLQRGESGFGIDAGLTTNKDAFGYGASFGYSFAGYFDLSGSVNGASFNQKLEYGSSSYGLSATSFAVGGTAYISREDTAKEPVSVAFSLEYERDYYSSQALSLEGANMNAEDFTFGCTLFRNFTLSPTDYIQPSVEVAYLISAGTTQQGPYNSGSSENILVYSAGLTYVVRSSTATEYLVTPAVVIDKHDVTFSLTGGVVFATSP